MSTGGINNGSRSSPVSRSHTAEVEDPAELPQQPAPEPEPTPVAPLRVQDGFSMDRLAEARERLGGVRLSAPGVAPEAPSTGLRVEGGLQRPTATADGLSAQHKVGAEYSHRTPGGYGFNVGLSGATRVSAHLGTANGVSSFGVAVDVSMTARAGLTTPVAGATASYTEGFNARFNVSMPEAVAHAVDPATVNPFDPTTMPTGAVVTLDGSHYGTTALSASFRALSVETKVTNAEGVSVAVERTSPTSVRVTAGPTEAVRAYNGVGLNLGVAQLRLGRQDNLGQATLRSAEFDLSTPEGAAGYQAFLAEGRLPSANGPGVSGVSTTERLTVSSTSQLGGRLGTLDGTLDLSSNSGSFVRTTSPDGSATGTASLRYGDNVGLSVSQRFGADGAEDLSARTYAYSMQLEESSAALLNAATGQERFTAGASVDFTLTEGQMRELQQATARAVAAGAVSLEHLLPPADATPERFAVAMARSAGSNAYGVAERLFTIAEFSDGVVGNDLTPVPGQVIIRP